MNAVRVKIDRIMVYSMQVDRATRKEKHVRNNKIYFRIFPSVELRRGKLKCFKKTYKYINNFA